MKQNSSERLKQRWKERPEAMRAVLEKANAKAGERNRTRWKNDPEKMRKIAAANAAKGTAKLTGSHFDANRLARHSAALTGRIQTGKMQKGPDNQFAKDFSVIDPEGRTHNGRNILHFVRIHPELFDLSDLHVQHGSCRAAKSLCKLRPNGAHSKLSWKGWRWKQ
jgi:hypothetical protein